MTASRIKIQRDPIRILPDPKRVIARPFFPGGDDRTDAVLERVLSLSDDEAKALLADVRRDFTDRHRNIEAVFAENFNQARRHVNGQVLSEVRKQLIGAYFSSEYSLESIALFNPSLVAHPDQDGLNHGELRFLLSLRACGEGHVSSVEFRSGVLSLNGAVHLDALTPFATTERPVDDKLYDKMRFHRKLIEMGVYSPLGDVVINRLRHEFTMNDLVEAIELADPDPQFHEVFHELTQHMMWVAHSNYHLSFHPDVPLCERVIFPVTENESRGIEDARFVRFIDDDDSVTYYGVYTAYNGFRTLPQIIETTDFLQFRINTLIGRCVQNKGMALFPRKIKGDYWMVSRLDGENIYLLRSDHHHFWNESVLLRGPAHPWEFMQIGNCGSPIETEAGWLLLTHGVGPMRQYWLGACLLDLQDPTRVIHHLSEPILIPTESERDGYVPNVVYSCGGIIHNGRLVFPYAVADSSSAFASVSIDDLLSCMR